jgi:hypothetical protein
MTMIAARRIVTSGSVIGIAAAGLMTFSAPAQANNGMYCDDGPRIVCALDYYPASAERWKVNNSPYSPGNDLASISFACTPGTSFFVTLSYINSAGQPAGASDSARCLTDYP